MTVLNLRGGNGSGKSFVHKWMIDNHDSTPLYSPNFFTRAEKKATAWKLAGDLYLIGGYQTGADSILFNSLYAQVQAFAQHGHVFFENVLVSGSKMSWLRRRQAMPDQNWIWATLDTPPEICVQRIYNRNGGKPINEQVIIDFNCRIRALQTWFAAAGERSVLIDHRNQVREVHDLLTEGGWDCGAQHEWPTPLLY